MPPVLTDDYRPPHTDTFDHVSPSDRNSSIATTNLHASSDEFSCLRSAAFPGVTDVSRRSPGDARHGPRLPRSAATDWTLCGPFVRGPRRVEEARIQCDDNEWPPSTSFDGAHPARGAQVDQEELQPHGWSSDSPRPATPAFEVACQATPSSRRSEGRRDRPGAGRRMAPRVAGSTEERLPLLPHWMPAVFDDYDRPSSRKASTANATWKKASKSGTTARSSTRSGLPDPPDGTTRPATSPARPSATTATRRSRTSRYKP